MNETDRKQIEADALNYSHVISLHDRTQTACCLALDSRIEIFERYQAFTCPHCQAAITTLRDRPDPQPKPKAKKKTARKKTSKKRSRKR